MRFLPCGPSALLVELDSRDAVLALHAEIERRRQGGWRPELIDVVPAARTVLLDGVADPDALGRELDRWPLPEADTAGPAAVGGDAPPVEIVCRYDGPDLADVAARWNMRTEQAVAFHTSIEHVVDFCGFAPGFGYLSGIGTDRSVPRHDRPRARVDAGSVAVAGSYTGIYPRASPGGWRILGHTDAPLWNSDRDPPALLRPGVRVRFRPV